MFQLINLLFWQAAHCTLHTTRCTLQTEPAPENAPKSELVHFIKKTFNTVHCTPCVYIAFSKCITLNCKHPKFA